MHATAQHIQRNMKRYCSVTSCLLDTARISAGSLSWKKVVSMRMRHDVLFERVLNVNYKAVFDISINDPLDSIIDIVHFDDLNIWIDSFHGTEVNHILYVLCSSSNTAS
jgi:hypothetical protein